MVSTTLARTDTAPVVTSDQVDLIKRTLARDATPDELKLYLFDCARQGVHPMDKLVHFTKRAGRYTPITSIDFMRIRAADTGECAGIDDAAFEGRPKGSDFAASVTVYRLLSGQRWPFTATARWSEYLPPPGQDHMWQKMPHTMLGKCAEALALRKGFPKQLAGLYVKEELGQADEAPPPKPKPQKAEKEAPLSPPDVLPSTPADLPTGAVRIAHTEIKKSNNGRRYGLITLSTGEETMSFDGTLINDCQVFEQTRELVVVKMGSTKYGHPMLDAVTRYEPPAPALPLDETKPVDGDDIAF